jgi:hypothetical protein
MSEPNSTVAGKVAAALQALRSLHILCRGPFFTPQNDRLYVLGDHMLSEAELIAAHDAGQFTPANIADFLGRLNTAPPPHAHELPPDVSEAQHRRRSQRVMLRLDVLVRFQLPEGHRQQTHAFTVAVNAHGGLLESPFRLTVGQTITLVNPQTGKEVGCTVVGVHQSSEGDFITAFEFGQQNPQFWAIAFPPLDWGPTEDPA